MDAEIVQPEVAAKWISQVAGSLKEVPSDGRLSVADLQIDPVLRSTVNDLLQCHVRHWWLCLSSCAKAGHGMTTSS